MVQPTPLARRQTAYDYNGSDPSAHPSSFVGVRFMRPRKDVGEVGLDPEVHGLVSRNNMVPPIPNARRKEAYDYNGSDPSAQEAPELPGKFKYAQRAAQHQDIGIHDVRPDVYVVVSKIINPVPVYRTPDAPETNYEPWEAIEAKKAKDKADLEADKKKAEDKLNKFKEGIDEETEAKEKKAEEALKASKEYHEKEAE